ncbi:hypothetical protein BJY00DRAFT_269520 [Aspergillus carlsbadensis]|nr:hypothetical protein BJY00DRAFT_269520 [Aspergillus carlsbadensis]
MSRTQCLLIACQCSLIHLLCLLHLALIRVEKTKITDCVKGRYVIWTHAFSLPASAR